MSQDQNSVDVALLCMATLVQSRHYQRLSGWEMRRSALAIYKDILGKCVSPWCQTPGKSDRQLRKILKRTLDAASATFEAGGSKRGKRSPWYDAFFLDDARVLIQPIVQRFWHAYHRDSDFVARALAVVRTLHQIEQGFGPTSLTRTIREKFACEMATGVRRGNYYMQLEGRSWSAVAERSQVGDYLTLHDGGDVSVEGQRCRSDDGIDVQLQRNASLDKDRGEGAPIVFVYEGSVLEGFRFDGRAWFATRPGDCPTKPNWF